MAFTWYPYAIRMMASVEVPLTVTATDVPPSLVGRGNVPAVTHGTGPNPVPKTLNMEPCAIPDPVDPRMR